MKMQFVKDNDIAEAASLACKVFSKNCDTNSAHSAFANALKGAKSKGFVIAWHDETDQITGLVSGKFNDVNDSCFLDNLAVSGNKRKKGIATQLLKAAILYTGQQGYDSLRLHTSRKNPDAVRVFESLGFRETTSLGLEFIQMTLASKPEEVEFSPNALTRP